ncbi:MAG: response regulator [Clostridia bacterium]|nr:response regulator [Clostridia bacterium]
MRKRIINYLDALHKEDLEGMSKIELDYWRNKIFQTITYVVLFGAVPMLLLGAVTFLIVDQFLYAAIEVFIAIVVTQTLSSKSVKVNVKKHVILVMMYFVGIFLLITVGPKGAGLTTVAFTLILAGLILDEQELWYLLIFNVIIFIVITLFLYIDFFEGTGLHDYKATWLINMGVTQVAGIGLLFLTLNIYSGIEKQAQLLKTSSEELKKNEERHEAMISNISDIIGILDLQGNILYRSHLTQSEKGQLIGTSFFDLLHKDDLIYFQNIWQFLKRAPDHQESFQCRINNGEGQYIPVMMTAINLVKNINISGILLNYRDITELKDKESALIEAKNQAEILALAKEHFLSTISHEIRTPLNGMIGMLQLLSMTEITQEQSELIEVSINASNGLLSVINDVLDFTKLSKDKMVLKDEKFNLRNFVEELLVMFKPSAIEKNLDLNMHIQTEIPEHLIGDTSRLRQLLVNLIGNAIKFTHQGSVDLYVELEGKTDLFVILHWIIVDTGIGIAPSHHSKIFNSFSQENDFSVRKYGGTGLGLAIAKGLVELMAGDIWVKSELGMGSEFHFTIRLKQMINHEESLESPLDETLPKLNVLLAEDDNINQLVVSKLCEKLGWDIKIAENGIEAFALYRDEQFDLVLMDIEMPICNGLEATGLIRNHEIVSNRHVPIIAMTAYGFEKDKAKCLNAGMDDYITKPVDFVQLKNMVRKNIKQ